MFNIGTQELLVILLLVFLLFGPRHIPEVAHALGKGLGDLRRALQGVEDSVRRAESEIPRLRQTLEEPPRKPAGSPPSGEVRIRPAEGAIPAAGSAKPQGAQAGQKAQEGSAPQSARAPRESADLEEGQDRDPPPENPS
ncbi:MAG: twin-arginine translocase TatA/TatE family subunit [Candidatus Eisenbacteria bacterium]